MAERIIEVIERGRRGRDGSYGLAVTQALAADFTATAGHLGYCFRCTSNLILSFESAGALANGWHCVVDAFGADVVLNPAGPQLVNGQPTITVPAGYSCFVFCDGTQLFARFYALTPTVLSALSPLSKSYDSGELTITLSGEILTGLPHGLGKRPTIIAPVLRCKVTEGGFVVGEETPIGPGNADTGITIAANATDIRVAYGVTIPLSYFGTTGGNITPANWALVVRAFA